MRGLLTETETDELQRLIIDSKSEVGAASFPLKDGYEVHPRGPAGADFPETVQTWLFAHGFERAVDTQRGPFYHRPT